MRPGLILLACLGLIAVAWAVRHFEGPAGPSGAEQLVLSRIAWKKLPGWQEDDPRLALEAFARSCDVIAKRDPERALGGEESVYGRAGDWQGVCAALLPLPVSADAARAWIEANFAPFAARNGRDPKGLFTGYYEPQMDGSLQQSEVFATPLLARPADLVTVDLGAFREELKGQRIAGRVEDGALRPYQSRAEIVSGALSEKASPIAWVRDPVDAFFLQIQGSGRVVLADGGVLRVGYDGQNGHIYTPIGRVLRKMGALDPGNISMRTIREWLEAHPQDADMVMDQNASYVFFRVLDVADPSLGPLGAEQVPLTPGRSLAVDRKFHALGIPIWLDATLPLDEAGTPGAPLRRLMIAQDTGGAITGPVRGDVFFGFGTEAETLAGRMKQEGRFFVLLPNALAARQP